MSAIYGIIGEATRSDLERMGVALAHRGLHRVEWSPAPGFLVGMRVTKSDQSDGPMLANVAADASIYNQENIAAQLGLSQDAAESAEVLVERVYSEWGPRGFARLNGDFAFCLWNASESTAVLARDPLGSRSLYVWRRDHIIAFASEYKALYALEAFTAIPDLEGLQYLQAAKYLPHGSTLLRDVVALRAGHWMEINLKGNATYRYWQLPSGVNDISEDTAESEVRQKFVAAVARRLDGAGQIGIELSGGLDSAGVVAAVRHLVPDLPIKTFTIGSGENDDEIIFSRRVARQFDTDHIEIEADPTCLLDLMPKVVWHLEDPIARTETALYYLLAERAARHVSVLLGGYAGDGLYAGMPKHKLVRLAQLLPLVDTGLLEFLHYTQTSREPKSMIGKALLRVYYGGSELPMPRIRGANLDHQSSEGIDSKSSLLDRNLREGILEGVPGWMPKVEKTHAAFDLEVRSPFTDPDLVAHAMELPEGFKMRGLTDKYILRKALAPMLPGEIAQRPKHPQRMEYDLALSESIDRMAEAYLSKSDVRARGFFEEEDIAALRRRPAGKPYTANRAMRLWTAVGTEIWARIFLDGNGSIPDDGLAGGQAAGALRNLP